MVQVHEVTARTLNGKDAKLGKDLRTKASLAASAVVTVLMTRRHLNPYSVREVSQLIRSGSGPSQVHGCPANFQQGDQQSVCHSRRVPLAVASYSQLVPIARL